MIKTPVRKLYSIKESYVITYLAFRSMPKLRYAKKHDLLSQKFIERLMLAVTEVNGCEICSYAHTKMALEAGMTNEEIQNMLSGIKDDVPSDEILAVMFAQHYADYRGKPSKKSWESVLETYGLLKGNGILAVIRIIMLGNAYGIPWSSFFNRFKRKADKRSNLLYELGMIFCSIIFVPIALIHGLIAMIFRVTPN